MPSSNTTRLLPMDPTEWDGELISSEHFGGVYVGFRNIDRFSSISDAAGLNMIRWPGGAAGEQADWYGLEFSDLVDEESPKSGLSEVASYAAAQNATLSVVIPTGEYAHDLVRARNDMSDFLARLADRGADNLPQKLILEIGNEHYAIPDFIENPDLYGKVASVMIEEVISFKALNPEALAGIEIETSVQMGRSEGDNRSIIDALSENAIQYVDHLVVHRFPWGLDDAANKTNHYLDAVEAWLEAGVAPDIGILKSEWNVASWTRFEARDTFISLHAQQFGVSISAQEIDLEARSNADFEAFWQNGMIVSPSGEVVETKYGISQRDYGLAQASALLETFSSGLDIGVDMASLYGVDTPYAGSVGFGEDHFVASDILRMMSESLPGTRKMELGFENKRDGELNVWAFGSEEKSVFYFSVDTIEQSGGEYKHSIDLSELGYDVETVSIRILTSTLSETWMEDHAVSDNPEVDETPEGRLFEKGIIAEGQVALVDGQLDLLFDQSFQIIEVTALFDGFEEEDNGPSDDLEMDEVESFIFGSENAETISGSDRNEVLIGRGGGDLLTGGGGDDVFVVDGLASVRDTILDYSGARVDLALGAVSGDIILVQNSFVSEPILFGSGASVSGAFISNATSGNVLVSFLGSTVDIAHWSAASLFGIVTPFDQLTTKLYDLDNDESFSEIHLMLGASGEYTDFLVLNDDGSRSSVSFDRMNEYEWERQEERIDSSGRTSEILQKTDIGDEVVVFFDNTDSRVWETFTRRYDDQDKLLEQIVVYDSGSSQRQIFDNAQTEVWQRLREDRDANGALYDKRVFYDNGIELRTILDVDRDQEWTTIQEYRSENGELYDKRFNYDDGSSQRIILNIDGNGRWSSIVELRDEHGDLYDKRTNYLDETRTRLVFDNNDQDWETIREKSTSNGDVYDKLTTRDSGESTRLIVDSENDHAWSIIVENRTSAGEMWKKTTTHDDGHQRILLLDIYGQHEWGIHSRLYDDSGQLTDEQFY